jgi:hypothetical protein
MALPSTRPTIKPLSTVQKLLPSLSSLFQDYLAKVPIFVGMVGMVVVYPGAAGRWEDVLRDIGDYIEIQMTETSHFLTRSTSIYRAFKNTRTGSIATRDGGPKTCSVKKPAPKVLRATANPNTPRPSRGWEILKFDWISISQLDCGRPSTARAARSRHLGAGISLQRKVRGEEEAITSIHPSAVLPNSLSSHHSTKSVFPEVKPSLSVYEQLASPAPIGIHPLSWTLQG